MKIGYLMQAGVPDVRQRPASGPANHVIQVIRALRQRGHEVRLLLELDGTRWLSEDLRVFRPLPVDSTERGAIRLFERLVRRIQSDLRLPWAAFFDSVRFARSCRDAFADVDVLYERMGWMGYGGMLASRWLRVPRVLEVNGDHLDEFAQLGLAPRGAQRRLSQMLMRRTAQQAAQVVASGEGWKQRFIERWAVPAGRVSVVENGSELVERLDRSDLRCFAAEEATDAPARFVFVGTFAPWSGLDILLEGFAKAKARGVRPELLLIGGGTDEQTVGENIRRLRLEAQVTRCGYLATDALADRLAASQVGVASYRGRIEYSGLKLYDYKAAGLATIASGVGGAPAAIEHERTGWIVPPGDSEAMSEAVVRLASDTALVKKMGREARIEAEGRHAWRHTAERLERVLLEVVRG